MVEFVGWTDAGDVRALLRRWERGRLWVTGVASCVRGSEEPREVLTFLVDLLQILWLIFSLLILLVLVADVLERILSSDLQE